MGEGRRQAALEAMARAPATFTGAVLFEPPVATGPSAATQLCAHSATTEAYEETCTEPHQHVR
jgi:hypothetical protein